MLICLVEQIICKLGGKQVVAVTTTCNPEACIFWNQSIMMLLYSVPPPELRQ